MKKKSLMLTNNKPYLAKTHLKKNELPSFKNCTYTPLRKITLIFYCKLIYVCE